MSSNYDPSRVFQVACPSCGAQPGEECQTRNGRSRDKYDFHSIRKGVLFPEFITRRHGLSDPTRKANNVMDKLDAYLHAREQFQASDHTKGFDVVAEARAELFVALKEGFTHGK